MYVLRLTPHFYWPQLQNTGWPVPFDTIGGMQTQIFRQTLGLSNLGVKQTVLTLKVPGTPDDWHWNERVTVRGVRVPVFPMRSRTRGMMDLNVSWALGVVSDVLRHHPSCDIVHVHCSGVSWPLLVGMSVSRLLKARLVLTIHCSILATYEAMHALDHALQPIARNVERMALRRADHTVVLSPRVRQALLEKTKMPAEALSIIPDSLDVDLFRSWATAEAIADFRQRFNLTAACPIITYVGRIAREKGWRHLVEIAERLKHRPFHLLICGDGNERDLLEAELARRGLSDYCTITGYLPQETIPATLAVSSVLILPSTHEEFGGVLIEAMAMLVPPVAFAVGGVPDTVQDGKTGLLVPAGDIAAMVGAIERLLDDPAFAKRLGDAGLVHVQRNFTLDAACHALYEIYQRISP